MYYMQSINYRQVFFLSLENEVIVYNVYFSLFFVLDFGFIFSFSIYPPDVDININSF